MAFRANEASEEGLEHTLRRYPRGLSPEAVLIARNKILEIAGQYGPVVQSYPIWHPFLKLRGVTSEPFDRTATTPRELEMPVDRSSSWFDHVIHFRDAFITSPYGGATGLVDHIHSLHLPIDVEPIDEPLYHAEAKSILIHLTSSFEKEVDGTISSAPAIAGMLKVVLECWNQGARRPEDWKTMAPYYLGRPNGARSSLFISQKVGAKMKKLHETLMDSGLMDKSSG